MALKEKGSYDDEDDWKVLIKKAGKFELKEVQKISVNREQLSLLEKLLNDAYIVRRPKPSEYEHRKQLIRVFNDIAKEIYGNKAGSPVVEEFGSFSMDLFTTGSDLDLSVNFKSSSIVFPRDQKIKALRKFARKFYGLQNGGHVRGVQPILSAKVPILKVIDAGTGVECDLSVENRDGISKSQIIRFITSIDERFPKLSFLMKAWAKAHDINSSKDRTLNSLSIILLVAFHLQTRDPPILPPFSAILKDGEDPASVKKSVRNFQNYGKRNTETLGELFVSLLIKLASVDKLWPKGLCASPYLGHWTSKTWDIKDKIASMSVEDFTDRTQNVARAVGKSEVEKINNCIKLTIRTLRSFMNREIQESELRGSLFGIDKNHHHPVMPKMNVFQENYIRNQRVMTTTNPVLTMNKVPNPNNMMDLRVASNLSTMPPPVGHWNGPQHRPMTTGLETRWAEQTFDHQPTKRMRVAEGVPATHVWGPASAEPNLGQDWREPRLGQGWGEPRLGQGWGEPRLDQGWGEPRLGQHWVEPGLGHHVGEPRLGQGWQGTGSWSGTHGPDLHDMQPARDPWGRRHQRPPNGNFSTYGHPPFR